MLEQKLVSLYNDIGLGVCDTCKQCKSKNSNLYQKAVGAWFVGKYFEEQKKRILFIGKNARGKPAEDCEENQNHEGFLEEFRYSRETLWGKGWSYWRYTREISKCIFGDLGMEAIAFTNMVKCNGSDTIDTTTNSMKDYCIRELGAVKHEIELIRPTHLVLYTGYAYDQWFFPIFDKVDCLSDTMISIGKRQMPYGIYHCKLGEEKIKVLRIGHPERKKKEDFIAAVVDWVNNG